MIETIENNMGETIGFYCHGHMAVHDFVYEVRVCDWFCESLDAPDPFKVKHDYWKFQHEAEDMLEIISSCEEDDPKSEKVTYFVYQGAEKSFHGRGEQGII